jgi:hypothetical protein
MEEEVGSGMTRAIKIAQRAQGLETSSFSHEMEKVVTKGVKNHYEVTIDGV